MNDRIFENGIQYSLHGDYYFPDLNIEPEYRPIGRWGRMHRDYLKEYHPIVFNQLVLSGTLWIYLADINEQAQQRLEVLVNQMMVSEGITEELKEEDQMNWIQRMNNVRTRAEKLIITELIYI